MSRITIYVENLSLYDTSNKDTKIFRSGLSYHFVDLLDLWLCLHCFQNCELVAIFHMKNDTPSLKSISETYETKECFLTFRFSP